MPSKIYMICNSYESGYGHGLQDDGLDLSKTPHADHDQGEAYQIGYEAGFEMHKARQAGYAKMPPNVELRGAHK